MNFASRSEPFEITFSGKWVLAGEHSVRVGKPALVFPLQPLQKWNLTLTFIEGRQFSIKPHPAKSVILGLIKKGKEVSRRSGHLLVLPKGSLEVKSTLPERAGLGSSAALCLALTAWLYRFENKESDAFSPQDLEFARQLENTFHGESSGMDLAGIAAGCPIEFTKGKGAVSLGLKKIPHFTFHDTGLRSSTSHCVEKVDQLRATEPITANRIDEDMEKSALLAKDALHAFDQGDLDSLEHLGMAMRLAHACFISWGLVPPQVEEAGSKLLSQGARAFKLTGSGGGGILVALW
jgi:mevalonate kinase